MGDLIHTSKIRIHQDQPPERRAYIEGFEEPLEFGVHGGIKHFYVPGMPVIGLDD